LRSSPAIPGSVPLPIVCDLGALSEEQRAREQMLLGEFRAAFRDLRETAQGFAVVLPGEAPLLSRLGEFLALERLCCSFLSFDLSMPAGRGPVTLHVHGGPGAKPFLRSVFFG
jgi:hypothetical protein